MEMIQIIGIGLVTAVLSLLVRQHRPEIAISLPILGSVVILLLLAPQLRAALWMFEDLALRSGIESRYIKIVIKIIGVAYICQFSAELCRDAGEGAMAGKIELAGKIMILTLSMPVIYGLFDLVTTIINF